MKESTNCISCNYTFSKGRGICGDWFCTERCRDWYDGGNTLFKDLTPPNYGGTYVIVAGPPDLEVGSIYTEDYRNPSANLTLRRLALSLDLPNKAVKKDCLEGRNGKIIVRKDGRNFWLEMHVSKRQVSALKSKLKFMYEEDGKFFMYRLPNDKESRMIREIVGMKKRPRIKAIILDKLKNNLPTPLETPGSCGKTP